MKKLSIRAALIFGAPGCGKGTQGELLGGLPGFHHFAMGEAFRDLDPASELGQTVKEFSPKGELVPDDITFKLLDSCLREQIEDGDFDPSRQLLILDGFPRNPDQVDLLSGAIEVLTIVYLQCDDENELIARLRRRAIREGRADDAREEVVRRRLEIYLESTQPVLSKYDVELVQIIDPIGTPAEVLARVLGVLAPVQAQSLGNVLAG